MADREPTGSTNPNVPGPLRGQTMGYLGELARAYVPPQMFSRVWSPAEGLAKGTIFPELYRPYEPGERA